MSKTGSKYSVSIETLKAFGAEIEKLPVKEKISYDIKEAVTFLRPFLDLAVEKNYTKDEILGLMKKIGWSISHNTFKYLWSLYLLEKENSDGKKKTSKKASKKIKAENSKENISPNEKDLSYGLSVEDVEENKNENETQEQNFEVQATNADTETNSEQKNKNGIYERLKSAWQGNSAHFEVTPDTENL